MKKLSPQQIKRGKEAVKRLGSNLPPLPPKALKPDFSHTAKTLNKQIDDMHLTRQEPLIINLPGSNLSDYYSKPYEQLPDIKMESLLSPTMIEFLGLFFTAMGLISIGFLAGQFIR